MEAYHKRSAQPESPRPNSFSSSDFFRSIKSFFTDPDVEVSTAYCPFCNEYVVFAILFYFMSRRCDPIHLCVQIVIGRFLSLFVHIHFSNPFLRCCFCRFFLAA